MRKSEMARRYKELRGRYDSVASSLASANSKVHRLEFQNDQLRADIASIIADKPGAVTDALIDCALLTNPAQTVTDAAAQAVMVLRNMKDLRC